MIGKTHPKHIKKYIYTTKKNFHKKTTTHRSNLHQFRYQKNPDCPTTKTLHFEPIDARPHATVGFTQTDLHPKLTGSS